MDESPMHIAMYPWFAMGHLIPYLQLSNKLAKKGHKISFFTPKRTVAKLQHLNHYPHLITFVPLTVPHVDGLPPDAETTSDVPFFLFSLLVTAMDRTEKDIVFLLAELKPQIVFFDFQYWVPNVTRRLGIKSLQYFIINPATMGYLLNPSRMNGGKILTEADLKKPPPGFPDSSLKLHAHELRQLVGLTKMEIGSGVLFNDRINRGTSLSDAIGFRGCREINGPYIDYLESQYGKPVLLSGPLLPDPPNYTLEENWADWLGGFKAGSVIYCAFGSEEHLPKNQIQELLLGLELTGFPFLAALKPPAGFETIDEALPEGFKERVQGRGLVHGGWVQQQLILGHPSVGCFITHCGAASITEGLVSDCQLVLLPRIAADHIMNARTASIRLKVGVEVEKEEDGLFTKETVCKAVKTVMDEENEVGREARANHNKVRNLLLGNNFESSCVDSFCHKLQDLI